MDSLKLQLVLDAADRITKPFKAMAKTTQKLQSAFGETTAKLKRLEDSARDLDQFKRLGETAGRNSVALKKAQETAQRLGRQMGATEKVSKKLTTQFEKARKEVTRLKAQQDTYQGKLSGLRSKLNQVGIATKNLALSERRLKANIKNTSAELDKHAAKMDKVIAKSNKLAAAKKRYQKTLAVQSNMSFVGGAGAYAGGRVLSGVGSMMQPGMQFEEAMSKVAALSRVAKTSEQFMQLNELAKELGATTSFSATESAEGMGYLAMAGFKTNAILQSMPGMLNLAKAGALDLGATADIASNILSGFGLEADQMNRVSDVLAATFSRSNVDLTMLGDTMKYVAPIAKELGVSIEEAAAMSGLLGNIGIQGSQAGTALRAIHSRLAAPPKMAAKAIAKIGLSVKDATGNMRPMVDILSDIAEKTKGMGNADRLGIFKHIAGSEAGAAFAELVNKGGADTIGKFAKVLEASNGEAKRIADTMADNAMGDLKGLNSAWEAVNVTLTETNSGPLRDLIQSGTNILRLINDWIKNNPELAATILKVGAVLGGIMAVMGSLALGIAGLLGPLAMAKLAFSVLNLTMLANPIAILVVSLIAAAGLIYAYWEPIKDFFATLWEGPQKALSAFANSVLNIWDKISAPISWIADKVGGLFGGNAKVAIEVAEAAVPKKENYHRRRCHRGDFNRRFSRCCHVPVLGSPGHGTHEPNHRDHHQRARGRR